MRLKDADAGSEDSDRARTVQCSPSVGCYSWIAWGLLGDCVGVSLGTSLGVVVPEGRSGVGRVEKLRAFHFLARPGLGFRALEGFRRRERRFGSCTDSSMFAECGVLFGDRLGAARGLLGSVCGD